MNSTRTNASLIWNIAELLRGSWKQHEYQDVILPFTVLKRLDSVLSDTKADVLRKHNQFDGKVNVSPILMDTAKVGFYNISPYDFTNLLEDQQGITKNFRHYLNGFSDNIKDIIEKFDFEKHLSRLEGGNLLYLILKEFNKVNLHPSVVDNHEMGSLFEELIRKFSEMSNETAGEHYTPREVIQLMVQLLFEPDKKKLSQEHIVSTIYDPACGTGGMLTVGKQFIHSSINPNASLYLYGQELNPVTYAIAKADMLIKGEGPDKIKGGEKDHSKASTLSNDQFPNEKFDYIISNPPYGVDWKKDQDAVEREAKRGYAGRFGAGLPRVSDGQLLFLQHMVSKMRNPSDGGSRIAAIFNGSSLFTGGAGSGESEIRRWIIENDWLEAVIALPDQLFYNTEITTYIWIVSNRKSAERKNLIQLLDARSFFVLMRKNLGDKRHLISDKDISHIMDLYKNFSNSKYSKIFSTSEFGYRTITVDRPLRLSFKITEERIDKIKSSPFFLKPSERIKRRNEKLDENTTNIEFQDEIINSLKKIGNKKFNNREKFLEEFNKQLKGINLSSHLKKLIFQILSEQDEEADVCLDKNGLPEIDSNLRDSENVPLDVDPYDFFHREIKAFISDAQINETIRDIKDGKVGKVGYEIPFTRYFNSNYELRSSKEVENDIRSTENELTTLLRKVL